MVNRNSTIWNELRLEFVPSEWPIYNKEHMQYYRKNPPGSEQMQSRGRSWCPKHIDSSCEVHEAFV